VRSIGWILGAVAVSALASGLQEPLLRTPAPVADGRPARLEIELDCARCHAEIAGEWAQTLHALAWIDPPYQESLKSRQRPESCHGCHVPVTLAEVAPGTKPGPRDAAAEPFEHGVSCATCHAAADGAMLGPFGAPTDAHVSRLDERFVGARSSQLCIGCHRTTVGPVIGIAKDFELAGLQGKGLSCAGCHMAPVERAHAVGADGAPSPVRPGRSHLLQTPRDPAFLRLAFGLELVRGEGTLAVAISNQAGHRVPGIQERFLDFTVELLGAGGEVLARAERRIDHRAPLLLDSPLVIELAAPAAPAPPERRASSEVRVRGTHLWPGRTEAVEFMDERLPVGG
jgi:hypothetical protein